MINQNMLVEKVFEMLKKRELTYRIDNSLKTHNLTPDEIEEVKNKASEKYNEYVVESIKKKK